MFCCHNDQPVDFPLRSNLVLSAPHGPHLSSLQMQLAPRRLSELHSDLKIQEKDEFQWKKLKVEGLDEDGEREAKLRRNFNGKTTQSWCFSERFFS